ncbi:acetyl-CoA carboxylase carboxyltransferase subunit alpha [Jiella avicenniae]|uniref:Acetyl-coenzyme A carboxylase carboxyl transferase subunit alpha n=1 Tax=Jiella avicenniae TaxID=2907202 RepID=A0A9X1P0S3_9HYPH|nr:acetyl-CoA carboxylase carboxyltransferase subunit alpha [Jiella avicenniae]MCE7027694.1 acetyl-CoA carboxylase carboxyltransferase subunit alpha [Jiella avicenniae]MCE7028736.1 acetyl-CoA carboxylase carboxyltransferase subunit alpha [Jiella avicenniae]
MHNYLDFEKPVADLEGQIIELRKIETGEDAVKVTDEIDRLEKRSKEALEDLYKKLTPWQKTQVARHPDRPHCVDYIGRLITDFVPLAGDRYYAEDYAVIAGFGRFDGASVAVIGQEKGADTQTRLKHNFGMARPEGYRKAVRIMDLAERFGIPVLTLVDTAGAYPGIGAEERGQAEAIARSIEACLNLKVPLVSLVIGEGGSGGAMAIAAANRVLMMEHAIYNVIAPEAGASILYRDAARARDVAQAMKMTAQDLMGFGIIDAIVEEPLGGAHRAPETAVDAAAEQIRRAFGALAPLSGEELKRQRREKFLAIGRNL